MAWYMTFSQNPILVLCYVYQISLETYLVSTKRTNVNLALHMPQAINTAYNLKWNLRPQTRGSILCFLFNSRLVNLMKLLKPEEYVWRYVGMVTQTGHYINVDCHKVV